MNRLAIVELRKKITIAIEESSSTQTQNPGLGRMKWRATAYQRDGRAANQATPQLIALQVPGMRGPVATSIDTFYNGWYI